MSPPIPHLDLGGWIHIFTVTDTQTAKGGYTIYKITSVIFPRSIPQALTCLTIWKRFHDVKRLHRELARRHKSLQLSGKLPVPTDSSFFKRFDKDVIRRRKEYILQLLDFAAQHPALYKCHAFTQFFSDAEQMGGSPTASPRHDLHLVGGGKRVGGGAIAEICDKLDLRFDPHDGRVATLDQATESQDNSENVSPSNAACVVVEEVLEGDVKTVETEAEKPCKDYTRFLTPMASIESDDSDYIYEAALEFSHAVEAEANLEYQNAYVLYKRGVEVLLNGSKDDGNDERKFIAKAKILKYLARADDIHDKFLRTDAVESNAVAKSNLQLYIDVTDSSGDVVERYLERPWNHLAKYKVAKVIGKRVMQVQSITEPQRPTYVMKGIEKPSNNSPTQTIFLPQQVPYMVDLLAFFQSEQKIFLLLKQAEGGRLIDCMRTYMPAKQKSSSFTALFPKVNETEIEPDKVNDAVISLSIQDSGYVEGDITGSPQSCAHTTTPTVSTEFSELVRCSQQLLQSVSNTLKVVNQLEEAPKEQQDESQILVAPETPSKLGTNDTAAATPIPEASLKQWARELAMAIHSLHEKGAILRDLYMDNLLLGAKGQLLLTYFYQNEGLNSADNYVHKAHNSLAVSGHFVAPEQPLTCKSDWWSFGVVLYQLLLVLPFKATHPGRIDIYGSVQYPADVNISESARDLLENLLQQAPETRFDYEQIRKHEFFKGTNWEDVRRNGLSGVNPALAAV